MINIIGNPKIVLVIIKAPILLTKSHDAFSRTSAFHALNLGGLAGPHDH